MIMETYLIQFLMAVVLFGCCCLLNIMAGDSFIKLTSYLGLIVSIGLMSYMIFNKIT
jgi:hypothetical protein